MKRYIKANFDVDYDVNLDTASLDSIKQEVEDYLHAVVSQVKNEDPSIDIKIGTIHIHRLEGYVRIKDGFRDCIEVEAEMNIPSANHPMFSSFLFDLDGTPRFDTGDINKSVEWFMNTEYNYREAF